MKTVKVTELQKQIAMVGAFAFALVGVGIWLVVLPTFKKVNVIQLETSQIGRKQELLKKAQVSRARIESLESDLLKDKEKLSVQSYITTVANRSGLEVDSVAPDSEGKSAKGLYSVFEIQVKASGAFQEVLQFMGEIERKKPKLAITHFALNRGTSTKNSSDSNSLISVSINVQTLLLNS